MKTKLSLAVLTLITTLTTTNVYAIEKRQESKKRAFGRHRTQKKSGAQYVPHSVIPFEIIAVIPPRRIVNARRR